MRKHPQLSLRLTSLLAEHFTCSSATTSLGTMLSLHSLHVQYSLRESSAFASQSAAVPAERAVLKALLSKLRNIFVPKIITY